MQVLAIVRSTATVGETETAHMKQCFQNITVYSGANPLHSPSPKNKKGYLEVRPVGTLPNISHHESIR